MAHLPSKIENTGVPLSSTFFINHKPTIMFSNLILLWDFLVKIPESSHANVAETTISARKKQLMGTLLNNFLYFGFVPSEEAYAAISLLPEAELMAWWEELEPALKELKGDDKDIGDYVVYQNFPAEVLAMSDAEYWIKQILIYWGVDQNSLQAEKASRPAMFEEVDLQVLHRAREGAMENIFETLLSKPAAWTDQDQKVVKWFIGEGFAVETEIPFKENLVWTAILCMETGVQLRLGTTTDVLRLAAGLSDGDISLNTPTKFKLRRPQRRFLLESIENLSDLEEGVMRHFEVWKRLFHQLHVGEYQDRYPKAFAVANAIRNGKKFITFNARVEALIEMEDPEVLDLLATRPGEFARRIVHVSRVFGDPAIKKFLPVLDGMATIKLLKLKRFLATLNQRRYRIFTPKGSWKKAQVVESKSRIGKAHREHVLLAIDQLIANRVSDKFGYTFKVDPQLSWVKLPTNDAEAVTRFSKGTVLTIPDNIRFIRTATYWQEKKQVCWMDNGWNFFYKDWQPAGTCCWDHPGEMKKAAVFSGDPVNAYDGDGKAAQMIDLNFEELRAAKVRYAVWNILSYSRIAFDDVGEVRGLMMMGEKPEKGKLLEPSRVTFSIPVTGAGLTKYICYVDLVTRKMVICDAGLSANVSSAAGNIEKLSETMPAFVEYLNSLPSMMDIFELFPSSDDPAATKILYSDEEVSIQDEKAFVFVPKNDQNSFAPLSMEDFLD